MVFENGKSEVKKEYRLHVGWYSKLMVFGILGIFSVIGIAMLILGVFLDSPPIGFALVWIAILLFMWYQLLTITHRIEVDDLGRIAFVSVLRRVVVNASAIQSIRPRTGHIGFLVVTHDEGKTNLLAQFDEFHVFLTNLKERNPQVKLQGC